MTIRDEQDLLIPLVKVDAVCINQIDAAEKERQVQMMKDIFSKAEVTYIWLGEATDGSDLAMDLISNIKREDFEEYAPEDPTWEALKLLFQRPWWTRTWVIQEALLSPRPLVKWCQRSEHGEIR